jgi:hypothetical protein
MNILSFILAIAAIVTFSLTYRGHKYGSIGLGLALLTTAWVLQLIWVTADTITV